MLTFDYLGAQPVPPVPGHPDVTHVLTIAMHRDGRVVFAPGTDDPEELARILRRIVAHLVENDSALANVCGVTD